MPGGRGSAAASIHIIGLPALQLEDVLLLGGLLVGSLWGAGGGGAAAVAEPFAS